MQSADPSVVVAMIDGSSSSRSAFELTLHLTRRSKAFSHFLVVHVFDPKAEVE
jgi:hypothetical protein